VNPFVSVRNREKEMEPNRFVLRYATGLAFLFGLAGCVPSPGPGDYASAGSYQQERAAQHAAAAQRDQSIANWRAFYGDYAGASAAQSAAAEQAQAAQRQQFQANKDHWLSGW
jgi:hypothetical protein